MDENLWDEIRPGLWLGGTPDDEWVSQPLSTDGWVVRDERPFDSVVTLFAHAQPFGWGVEELRYGFADGRVELVDMPAVIRCAEWAHGQWKAGQRVLVRCQAGLNRSGLVMAMVLILDGWEPGEAVALMRDRRSQFVLCNEEFDDWIAVHGQSLREQAQSTSPVR